MLFYGISNKYQENKTDLVNRIRDQECCVFVGAGLSVPAGYPSWSSLLIKLKCEAEKILKRKINDGDLDFYERAEEYKKILKSDAYHRILNEEFNPNNDKQPWLPAHIYLVEMPFVSYISTNYDCILENAYIKKGLQPIYNYYPILSISHLRDRHIYHIHGIIDHTRLNETQDSVILTKSDFDEAYKSGSNLLKFISCIYTELTILFVGFNVRDQFMMRILKNSLSEFEQTKKIAFDRGIGSLKQIRHYALLPYSRTTMIDDLGREYFTNKIDKESTIQEDEELGSLGVNSIRYVGDDHNHTELINIIRDMSLSITGVRKPSIFQDLTFRGL